MCVYEQKQKGKDKEMANPAATTSTSEGETPLTIVGGKIFRPFPNATDREYPMVKFEFISDKGLADLLACPMVLAEHKAQFKALRKKRAGPNTYRVEYNYGKSAERGMGRLYGNGACLQGIKARSEPHRQFLCGREYHDIDQVNSAPALYLHLLQQNNLVCPELTEYVADRATCLSRWNMKKKDFLATLNRQQPPAGPKEVVAIHSVIYEKLLPLLRPLYPEIVKKVKASREKEKKANPKSSFLSVVVQTVENSTLLAMYDFFIQEGWCPDVLMFDGLQVRRREPEGPMPEAVLRRCEAYVKERKGVAIRLAEKPMEVPQSFLENNNLTLPSADDEVITGGKPFDVVRDTMLAAAKEMRLCKDRSGNLYRFENNLPYACTMWMSEVKPGASQEPITIMKWMQDVLMDNPASTANSRVMGDVCKVLTENRFTGFDFVSPNREYFGFANGILHLPTAKFTPAEDVRETENMIVYRYFNQPYTGETATPLLDSILDYQFPETDSRMAGVKRMFFMMIGRTFIKLDNWQVMMYLQGESQTGKSVAVKICQNILPHFGTITDGFDVQHGLSDLYNKDLVTWDDLTKAMATVFPGDLFQSCVTNGSVAINPKYEHQFTCKSFYPPFVGAGNRPLPYDDNRGQTSRKTISFEFTRTLSTGNPELIQEIIDTELPNIICKALGYYVEDFAAHRKELIWQWCPEYFREQRDEMRAEGNPWYRFIRNCPRLEFRKGAESLLSDVRALYKEINGRNISNNEGPASTFTQVNPDWTLETITTCKVCGGKHQAVPKKCCDGYTRSGKTNLIKIIGLRILPPPPEPELK
jgi:hypothetical protein